MSRKAMKSAVIYSLNSKFFFIKKKMSSQSAAVPVDVHKSNIHFHCLIDFM